MTTKIRGEAVKTVVISKMVGLDRDEVGIEYIGKGGDNALYKPRGLCDGESAGARAYGHSGKYPICS
ncbi:hypothetical protein [Gracilibacillus phocaeensis]|uniref:hypothetical protein n=1 Tax=Gracilibacillus phocaeensis TaxID=2042304 RepID=UPI0013EF014A|nr:hypothetical protein [Gracilibacillus phocaeensis]